MQGSKREIYQYGEALIRKLDARKHARPVSNKTRIREVSLPHPIAYLACLGLLETIETRLIGKCEPGEILLIFAAEETPKEQEEREKDCELYGIYHNALMFGTLSQTVITGAYIGFVELGDKTTNRNHKKYADIIGVDYGRITIRMQKSRWGSCSSKGNLNFNCLLMNAPDEITDYVIVHELCHRKEMNHSPKFWAHVEAVLPDYKERRKWLKDHGNELYFL